MCRMNQLFRMALLLAAALFLPVLAGQAAEALDPSFGEQGVVITDFGIADDEASALAVQADGKILLAGFSSNTVLKDIAIARFLSDGTLDLTFHGTGYLSFNVGDGNALARAIAVQNDGRIVVAGNFDNGANEASTEIFLVRLTEEGEPDVSFGVDGKLVLPLAGQIGSAFDLQISAEGDIFVAGTVGAADGSLQAMVARITPQGVLDPSFAESGIAIVSREYETAAHSLALLIDNSILLAGYSKPGAVAGLSFFRLKEDGTVDESFGTQGEVQVAVEEGEAILYDMVVQADGRLVITGSYDNGSYREVLLGRFLATGEADPGFGTGGLVRNDLGYDSVGYGVAVLNDGSILASGFSQTDTGKDIILLRYVAQESETEAKTIIESPETLAENPTLSALASSQSLLAEEAGLTSEGSGAAVDTTVSPATASASYISESVSVYDDESHALVVLADGRVLAAGYASNGENTDFALLQYSAAAVDTLAESIGGTGGVSVGNFLISTTPVTAVSRNSAMSGGSITERISKRDCETYCEAQCNTGDTVCYDACYTDCRPETAPTVTARGVCYGTARHPVYREAADETDTTASTDTGETDSTSSILPAEGKETSYNYETVLHGQTSDGSGVGTFGSNIIEITPNTSYYVRAYALLSDGTVIYGNEFSFKTSDACFIATAAYGSLLDRHVVQLRMFRDTFLKGNLPGRFLISLYYRVSPEIAETIQQHEFLKQVVRICLWPWVAFSFIMLHLAAVLKIFLLLLGILAGIFVIRRSLNKHEIRKLS